MLLEAMMFTQANGSGDFFSEAGLQVVESLV